MFPAEDRNLVAKLHESVRALRAYRVWHLLLMLAGLMSVVPAGSAKAAHCGRAGYLPEWNQTQMAWEGSLSVADPADQWRMRGRGCDGPLCQSRTPEPLTPQSTGAGFTVPMPWRCTAMSFGQLNDDLNSVVAIVEPVMPVSPILDALFKPPRNV